MTSSWTPEGVAHLVATLREAGVTFLHLEIAALGLKLEIGQQTSVAPPLLTDPSEPADQARTDPDGRDRHDLVTAPLLGVFYRGPAPDEPPLVAEGEPVAAGQPLGLLEVMKTYHEVTSPRAGILAAFLVDDGQYVEYGQPLARLSAEPPQ